MKLSAALLAPPVLPIVTVIDGGVIGLMGTLPNATAVVTTSMIGGPAVHDRFATESPPASLLLVNVTVAV